MIHSQQQLLSEEWHTPFGHSDHVHKFAGAQQVVQISIEGEPFVDEYATVSLPPKIQRPYPEPQFPPTNPPK